MNLILQLVKWMAGMGMLAKCGDWCPPCPECPTEPSCCSPCGK
jgi:hypothetical protein